MPYTTYIQAAYHQLSLKNLGKQLALIDVGEEQVCVFVANFYNALPDCTNTSRLCNSLLGTSVCKGVVYKWAWNYCAAERKRILFQEGQRRGYVADFAIMPDRFRCPT